MPPVGFEPTISAGERPQTYALERAATGTGTTTTTTTTTTTATTTTNNNNNNNTAPVAAAAAATCQRNFLGCS